MALSRYKINISERGEELLDHGTAAFPVAAYHDNLKVDQVPWHWHDQLELAIVKEGQVELSAANEKIIIPRGDAFFVNAGVLHTVVDYDCHTCRLYSMVFLPRFVSGGVDSIFWIKYLQPLLADICQQIIHFKSSIDWQKSVINSIENAWLSVADEPPGFEFSAREALSKVIFSLSEQRPGTLILPSEKSLRDNERIKSMLIFIQEHYGEEICSADIAGSALISESECLRCFRHTVGTTPIQYLKQFRIQKAADHLLASDLTITEVATRCGFQEMSYFAKIFKALRGLTPSDYRKKKQSAD